MKTMLRGVFIIVAMCAGQMAVCATASDVVDVYTPVKGGWHVRISADPSARRLEPGSQIGVNNPKMHVEPNLRQHVRCLYPSADRRMILTDEQIKKTEGYPFRPVILAYNAPRFTFDYYSAGGVMGQLYLGIISKDASKWLHEFSELDITFTDGRVEYKISDPALPGLRLSLSASALAQSAGLILKIRMDGIKDGTSLVWMYGGASTYYTNWNMSSPDFKFQPKHCFFDLIGWDAGKFTLTRRVEESVDFGGQVVGDGSIMALLCALPKHIPGWTLVVHGGSTWKGRTGFGDPNAVASGPAELVKATNWAESKADKKACVAVQEIPLSSGKAEGYFVTGIGSNISEDVKAPKQTWAAAMKRNAYIASRVVTHTPDPYLDSAVPMMAYQTEGSWGDNAYLTGAWSWRLAQIAWRNFYGPVCYGWFDNVRTSILNHARVSIITEGLNKGAVGFAMDYPPSVYSNCMENYVDEIRQYWEYTNDIETIRQLFPVVEGIVEWENRRLRPSGEYLYENSLNTWISDNHWYTRAMCTQASAYELRMNDLLADMAEHLGKDPAPYKYRAQRIREAMQRLLWQKREGVFAEHIDTRGYQMLHPQPELPTIYHSAEFGAADPLQIYQMLYWGDTNLKTETTPGGGKQYWSSCWFPNTGGTYTHSTYEMAFEEELNYACANYISGRADESYALLRSTLCGIYNGPAPGGLSCHSSVDGTQRANYELADASSMWGRTLVEGLFGIMPKCPHGYVDLSPQFPSGWPEASITTPYFSYSWKESNNTQNIEWESTRRTSVHLRLPLRASAIERVTVDGKTAKYLVEPGVELAWLLVETPPAKLGTINVSYRPSGVKIPESTTVKQGSAFKVSLPGVASFLDPQGILRDAKLEGDTLRGTVGASPGPGLVFVSVGDAACRMWVPVKLMIEPSVPVQPEIWAAPKVPGNDLSYWTTLDLAGTFNASASEVCKRVHAAIQPPPLPASEGNALYYQAHLLDSYYIAPGVSDSAWRKKVGADGIAWTTEGIPFKTSKDGKNIATVTLEGEGVFPASVEFPVNASGKTLYLMISGITFAMQSHVTNVRTTLWYADGTVERHDMVNPFDISDCWSLVQSRDTAANGYETIGGDYPAPSTGGPKLRKRRDDVAQLVAFDLKQGTELKSVKFEAIANDVIFGVMGATILK